MGIFRKGVNEMKINNILILSLVFVLLSAVTNGFEIIQSFFDFAIFYGILFIIDETYDCVKGVLVSSK